MGFQLNTSVLNQKGSPAIYTDTFANRPPFGYAGRLFISNDTAAIYEDTGTAWVLIANVSSGAGTLQQVTTNGNTSNVGISVTAGGVSSNSLTVTTLTPGSVPFVGTAGLITQDNTNLFFDDTNNRLGINTNTPSNNLDVHGTGTSPLIAINNTAGNQSLIGFAKNSTAKWRIGNSSTDFFEILNVALTTNAIRISSANNSTVFISSVQADDFLIQPTGYSLLASLSRNLTGTGYGVLSLRNNANGTIQPSSLTVDRTYTLPDATGTIALTSDLSAYLPLSGGTLTGDLTISQTATNNKLSLNNGTATTGRNWYFNSLNTGNLNIGNVTTGDVIYVNSTGTVNIGGATYSQGYVSYNLALISASPMLKLQGTSNAWDIYNSTFLYFAFNASDKAYIDNSTGVFVPVSDINKKKDFEDSTIGLNSILRLKPTLYRMLEEENTDKHLGFIAQEVKDFIPQAYVEIENDNKKFIGLNYQAITATLVKAMQEQQTLINGLLQRIELLENK
jgi:hypothetical protein